MRQIRPLGRLAREEEDSEDGDGDGDGDGRRWQVAGGEQRRAEERRLVAAPSPLLSEPVRRLSRRAYSLGQPGPISKPAQLDPRAGRPD